MAKLHSYYILCPLIDQKSFLGVSKDKEAENVIVTLGRNVINKHRLSDQKQIGGWTSKEHITSEVIYDEELDSYVGVFSNNIIKIWKNDAENLDKLKKYKFPLNILKVLPRKDQSSLILFTNGTSISLVYGLENRKSLNGKSVLKSNETIVDIGCYTQNNTDFICFIARNSQNKYEIYNCSLRAELGDIERVRITKESVTRPETDAYIVGKLISVDETPVVFILWSDSKLTSFDLTKKKWKTIGSVPWISTKSDMSLAWMGDKHLIFFGSNIDEDGAIIIAYNISLGVGSCRYPMKMYTKNAKLYCFNRRIILESSNHIGMLPYVIEASRSLSSLLGSHEINQNDRAETAEWGTATRQTYKLSKNVAELVEMGLPERAICVQVVPSLLEKGDFKSVINTLNQFNDIPESVLVLTISFCLKKLEANAMDIRNLEEFKKFSDKEDNQDKKLSILNSLFEVPFSDALLIPCLRDGLSLDDALFLLTYISHILVDPDYDFDSQYESKLFDWCNLLMDSFYQQFLLSKDENIIYVLGHVRDIIEDLINKLMMMDHHVASMNKLVRSKGVESNDHSLAYTIELMHI